MPSSPAPRPQSALAVLLRLAVGVKHWAPIWIPSVLLWQFTARGLQPAMDEARRLERIAPEVDARHAEAQDAFEQVQAEAQAWQDPVYRERRRRMRFQEPPAPEPIVETDWPAEDWDATDSEQWADVDSNWVASGENLTVSGPEDWSDSGISDIAFLEGDGMQSAEPTTTGPILNEPGTWALSDPTPPTEPALMSAPTWTVSEPTGYTQPEGDFRSPAQNEPAGETTELDSPFSKN